MPQFSTRPPEDSAGHGLPLLRTPANGRLTIGVTCDQMIGCPTHWHGGRTIPCEAENCAACLEGSSWRWHGYISGLIQGTRRHVLAEFTAQACEAIAEYSDSQGTLRGAILTAQRHKNRHNGRVLINITAGVLEKMNLPKEPDIIAALSKIWNLPKTFIQTPSKERKMRRAVIAKPKSGNDDRLKVAGSILPQDLH